ncbi:phosphorylase [Clostridium sp.]|uniref:phosphorylase family protein n=1 Tax=Clostridium sp. TaxID=1506 RepID=UPI002FC811DF
MGLYSKLKENMEKYSGCTDFLYNIYGLDEKEEYEAIILAPSWKPEKIFKNFNVKIELVKSGPYYNGYVLQSGNKKYGYIQTSAGAPCIVDCCLTLGSAKCNKIIFVGAVGALKEDMRLGDIITPSESIAGDGASLYLQEEICSSNFHKIVHPKQHIKENAINIARNIGIEMKEKVVYCTDSIFCEYLHLNEILELGSEAIEMETSAFYRCMEIMNKDGIAILCVSDNSATQNALVGRSDEDTETFHRSRETLIPKLILSL